MKKITKRSLAISGVFLGMGAIATAITLPIVLTATGPSSIKLDDEHYIFEDGNGNLVTKTVQEIRERLNQLGQGDNEQLTRLDYYQAFFLYKIEQKASLKYQAQWFKWEIYDLENQIELLNKDQSQDKKEKEEKLKTLNEKLDKVKDKLKTLNYAIENDGKGLEYDKSWFKNDFPKVLLPLEKIRQEQSSKYADVMNNEIGKYTTRNQGKEAWEKMRREKYNGAISDDEAIDFQTNKEIQKDAYGQFNFKIVDEYTYEQKHAVDKDGNLIFEFLKNARQKDGLPVNPDLKDTGNDPKLLVGETDKKTKVYFVGNSSKDLTKIYLDLNKNDGMNGKILEKITEQELLKVQHFLIGAIQDEKGPSLPFKFIKGKEKDKESRESLLAILSFFGNENKSVLNTLLKIFDNKSENDKDSETLINNFSGDDGTKGIKGSLGVKTLLQYLKEMTGGFGFGILADKELKRDDERLDKDGKKRNYLAELKANLEKTLKQVWKENVPTNQKELNRIFGKLEKEHIDAFGYAIKETFDPHGKGLQLWYPAGDNANIFITEFGIHIVKVNKLNEINNIKQEINDDLTRVANDQDVSKSHTKWGDLFSSYFDSKSSENQSGLNTRRIFILENYNETDELAKMIDEGEKSRERPEDKRINLEDIKKLIVSLKNSQRIFDIDDALGKKIQEFYEKEINEGLRQHDKTLLMEDIFKKLIKNSKGAK